MKRILLFLPAILALSFISCSKNEDVPVEEGIKMSYTNRTPYSESKPESGKKGEYSFTTSAMRLNFFGSKHEECYQFSVDFPADHKKYRAAYLTYTMCGWGEGPADWDMTTIISIKNKADGKWYEFVRGFTPYGGSFSATWSKNYYLDITEFLPMMEDRTDFNIYYCGWDATETKAHAVKLGFDFFEGTPEKNTIFTAKVYDSSENSIPEYRRCWPYGCDGYSIEDNSRLGKRTVKIPAGVKSAEVRVDITGHGMDPGVFPNRKGYTTRNAAEFDYNYYTVIFNGKELDKRGYIFESNEDNYKQAGTYYYDRAGWGPGKMANVQYWEITNIPAEGTEITLDFNLEEFKSYINDPNTDSNAYYIIETDIFGFDN